jgi:hypothetical protein
MIITKSRAALITLATSAAFAVAGLAPAASQAQWHNYCTAGHCITHSNYTLEGVHACGPSDYLGGSPSSGSSGWTKPITDEGKAAQAEQDQLTQFEGACPNA